MKKRSAMYTIKLRVNEKIYKNLMRFLSRFNKEEIQIIEENDEFLSVQQYLEKELQNVESGKGDFINMDQLDDHLEATIRKYEANNP